MATTTMTAWTVAALATGLFAATLTAAQAQTTNFQKWTAVSKSANIKID